MLFDEIKPHRSVGDLLIGTKEQDIVLALGDGCSRKIDEWGDVELEYEEFNVRFTFWGDYDFRLGCISTERPTASIEGHVLFGQSKTDVKEFVVNVLQTTISETDGCMHEDEFVQEWIDVDSHGLSFWFDNDSLYLIDVFCSWSDPETPEWPELDK